jgi:hypothetical protein
MYIAMIRDKPIIFRSLVPTLKANGTVQLSSEGVRDLMLNLSRIVDTKDAVSSNPADTFEALIGAGMEDELNRAARSALSAAAVAAGEDVSVLDAFVLGEPELLDAVAGGQIDTLLLSGDVFDAANPPQDAVGLYFDFLKRLADLRTIKAVITGGNHDSASHLNAPRELLKRFEVHVFGHAGENIVDLGEAVVAAVPFLRERDLRQASAGEAMTDVQSQVGMT